MTHEEIESNASVLITAGSETSMSLFIKFCLICGVPITQFVSVIEKKLFYQAMSVLSILLDPTQSEWITSALKQIQ